MAKDIGENADRCVGLKREPAGMGLRKQLDSCLGNLAFIPGVRNRPGKKAGGRDRQHRALWQELHLTSGY